MCCYAILESWVYWNWTKQIELNQPLSVMCWILGWSQIKMYTSKIFKGNKVCFPHQSVAPYIFGPYELPKIHICVASSPNKNKEAQSTELFFLKTSVYPSNLWCFSVVFLQHREWPRVTPTGKICDDIQIHSAFLTTYHQTLGIITQGCVACSTWHVSSTDCQQWHGCGHYERHYCNFVPLLNHVLIQ